MFIYFIRHGMPDYQLDVLTKEGREQAEKTSIFLANENIDLFFVSPAGRAKETAKRTLEKVNKQAKVIDWMEEEYLAKYTQKTFDNGEKQWFFWVDEFIEKFKILDNNITWYKDDLISTTSLKKGLELENRNVDNFLFSLGIYHDRKKRIYTKTSIEIPEKIAIFAHGAMAYAFLSSILDVTYPHFVNTHNCLNVCGIAKYKIDFNTKYGCKELFYNKILY